MDAYPANTVAADQFSTMRLADERALVETFNRLIRASGCRLFPAQAGPRRFAVSAETYPLEQSLPEPADHARGQTGVFASLDYA